MNTLNSATLVLAAHGSPHGSVNQNLVSFSNEVRNCGKFQDVKIVFHYGQPNFSAALDQVEAEHVVVLPLMTSGGYFSKVVLPTAIQTHPNSQHYKLHYLQPIGQSPVIADQAWQLAANTCKRLQIEAAKTRVLFVGHGTRKNAFSRETTFRVADRFLRINDDLQNRSHRFRKVTTAFIDDRPSLSIVAKRLQGCPSLLVLPFLISDGPHFRNDLPSAFGCGPISEPHISFHGSRTKSSKLVIERPLIFYDNFAEWLAEEAAQQFLGKLNSNAPKNIRVGTRQSPLALRQAEIVSEQLHAFGSKTEIISMTTSGDMDCSSKIADLPVNTFTDSLDDALASQQVDVAVHSYKDLDPNIANPEYSLADFRVIAVLRRGDPREVLCSQNGSILADLVPGARVGTSCTRRAAQLLRMRPDITMESIRGPVDSRLTQLINGNFDAVILAAAGLQRLNRTAEISQVFSGQEFLPAAAQAALVVQTRKGDATFAEELSQLDHYATRMATDLEWQVERFVRQRAGWNVGVLARYTGQMRLQIRLIDPNKNCIGYYANTANTKERCWRFAKKWLQSHLPKTRGKVFLVGAGPGDAELISVKGRCLLRTADVVIHDRLVSPVLLTEIRDDAFVFDVGKFPERHKSNQNRISKLLVEHGSRGKLVVRLKGGDPFVFGRGSEELNACKSAGVRCRVVPGISSSLAAPAAAGIPVTERGVATTLAITTGEMGATYPDANFPFVGLSGADTVVTLMGRRNLKQICEKLISAGRSPDTSVACIQNATLPQQRVVAGTLRTIVELAEFNQIESPMVLVVGDVVAKVRHRNNKPLPLEGRRIAITRQRSRAKPLVRSLFEHGAEVIVAPMFRIANKTLESKDIARLNCFNDYQLVALTSPNAVQYFIQAIEHLSLDIRKIPAIASVGPATTAELHKYRLRPEIEPTSDYSAIGLAKSIQSKMPIQGKILHACSAIAAPTLSEQLTAMGWGVDRVAIYDNIPLQADLQHLDTALRPLDAVVFCSSSAVEYWVQQGLVIQPIAACIGSATEQKAKSLGFQHTLIASESTTDAISKLLVNELNRQTSSPCDGSLEPIPTR